MNPNSDQLPRSNPASVRPSRRVRFRRIVGIGALVGGAAMVLAMFAPALHLLDTEAIRVFGTSNQTPEIAAIYVSGDMGLRFGMGGKVASALADQGIPVIGVSSSFNFGTHRTRAEVNAIVADAIRTALKKTGAKRVVLMGQSFGADIVAAAAPDLPPDLRVKVAAITLVVPSQSVFFRSDPTGITYNGTPDAQPLAAMRALNWAPVICIYGVKESDSLCPALGGGRTRVIGLPGGHFLGNDDELLVRTIVGALHAVDPTIIE